MRRFGCKPGQHNSNFHGEGSDGKGNQILRTDPLSEKSGVGSLAQAREGDRVSRADKEICIG